MHDGPVRRVVREGRRTSAYYRIMVDGRYVTAARGQGATPRMARTTVKISFASRAIRRIRIGFAYMPFGGLDVGPNDTVWLPPALPVGGR